MRRPHDPDDTDRTNDADELDATLAALGETGGGDLIVQLFRVVEASSSGPAGRVKYCAQLPIPLPDSVEAYVQELRGGGEYELRAKVRGKIVKKVRFWIDGLPRPELEASAAGLPARIVAPLEDRAAIEAAAEERLIRLFTLFGSLRGGQSSGSEHAPGPDPQRAVTGYVETLKAGIGLGEMFANKSAGGPAAAAAPSMIQDILAVVREAVPLLAYIRGGPGAPPPATPRAPDPVTVALEGVHTMEGAPPVSPSEMLVQLVLSDVARRCTSGESPQSVAKYALENLPAKLLDEIADNTGDGLIQRVQQLSQGKSGREVFFNAAGIEWLRGLHASVVEAAGDEEEGQNGDS